MKPILALLIAVMLALLAGLDAAAASQDRVFNVREFGATGDGVTLDTKSVQAAIAACHANGGGIVELPQGNYHVGTLEMLSNVTLKLNDGATLLGSQTIGDYAAAVGGLAEEPAFQKCLIHAENATNVGFQGAGTIDGRGGMRAFPIKVNGKAGERPSLMRLANCQRVRFTGLTFKNPASWGLHLVGCQDVRFDGVTIHSRDNNANNDGIDLDGCRDVVVENCRINSGDDAVCLKSTLAQPCSNIVVRSCQLSSKTAGFKLGTSSRSGFVDIRVVDSRFHDCPMGAVKLLLVDGGRLENVTLERLTMENVGGPIFIRLGNRGRLYDKPAAQIYEKDVRPEGAQVGVIRGITIRHVTARVTGTDRDRQAIMITGIPGHRVQDVVLEDIDVRFPGGGTQDDAMRQVPEDVARYPEQYFFGVLPAWALFVRHADGIRLRNVKLDCHAADARPPVFLEDVGRWDAQGVLINGRPTTVAAPLQQPQK
jgi:polygalacturonase